MGVIDVWMCIESYMVIIFYEEQSMFWEELTLCCDLQAASLRIAEQYMQAFSNIAKEVIFFFYFI